MAGAKRTCSSCGNGFIGRAGASYCSPACKQRAHRGRRGANRNAEPAQSVTDTPAARPRRSGGQRAVAKTSRAPGVRPRSAEAVALLAALDAELAAKAEDLGLSDDERLELSAAEAAVLDMVASEVDRKVDLQRLYDETNDPKLMVKLSGEIRLLESNVARLLKQISTDLPEKPSTTSTKAQMAANTRWARRRQRGE